MKIAKNELRNGGHGPKTHARTERNGELRGQNGETAIKLYLREIGRLRPMTPQEEVELVARVRKGDRRARERLIRASLPVVVKIAREYGNTGLPLLDLVSEGNLGLLRAVEQLGPARNGGFSASSASRIQESIRRALGRQSRTARPLG